MTSVKDHVASGTGGESPEQQGAGVESITDNDRLTWLALSFRHCPHMVIRFNDDADDEDARDARGPVPLGWSIWIDGCAPLAVVADSFRDVIDKAIRWTPDDEAYELPELPRTPESSIGKPD